MSQLMYPEWKRSTLVSCSRISEKIAALHCAAHMKTAYPCHCICLDDHHNVETENTPSLMFIVPEPIISVSVSWPPKTTSFSCWQNQSGKLERGTPSQIKMNIYKHQHSLSKNTNTKEQTFYSLISKEILRFFSFCLVSLLIFSFVLFFQLKKIVQPKIIRIFFSPNLFIQMISISIYYFFIFFYFIFDFSFETFANVVYCFFMKI